MKIFVTNAASELGRVVVGQLVKGGHEVTGQVRNQKGLGSIQGLGAQAIMLDVISHPEMTQAIEKAQPEIILNLTPQFPNTLLHDGQDWRNYDSVLINSTSALLAAVKAFEPKLLIHTSYAFLYGNARDATEDTPLQVPADDPIFGAAIQAEKMIAGGKVPYAIARMGFLYGPQSHDLALYVKSFNIFRPYYAGPNRNRSNFLHFEDAASALALIAEKQPAGEIFNVVDGNPTSFGDFIDHFANRLGRLTPAHIPTWGVLFAQLIIRKQQIELLNLVTSVNNDKIQGLGWTPQYRSYRQGLAQVVQDWQARKVNV